MRSRDESPASAEATERLLGGSDADTNGIELSPLPLKDSHLKHKVYEPGGQIPTKRGALIGFLLGVAMPILILFVIWVSQTDEPLPNPRGDAVQVQSIGSGAYDASTLKRPEGIKIVGVVFYGRRQFVDILDCYLRRNLASNGGYFDEVHFLLHPSDDKETPWLQELIKNSTELQSTYKLFHHEEESFVQLWADLTEPDTLYIKIDDDIIYMHEDAIPILVHTLLDHPEVHNVQSNVINNGWSHWMHWHTDAVHAYLPEMRELKNETTVWRASELPQFHGDPNQFNTSDITMSYRHRWLPVGNDSAKDMEATPIMNSRPPLANLNPPVERNPWEIGAQELYSLLQNIEANTTDLYWAGNAEGIWNLWYTHYSINLMAMWGKDMSVDAMAHVNGGDETALTEHLPKIDHRPVKIATRSIVGHFSNYKQRNALLGTDLLDRFRAYANEMVCAADNQKVAFPIPPGCSHVDIFVC